MKRILFLLFTATMTNIQGIMAQEKITQTTEADGKAAFQREMIFWLRYPRSRYLSAMSLSSRDAATTGTFTTRQKAADSWFAHLAFEVPGENTSNGYADMFL